jgi:sec-independent protein translocase protein TatC
VAAQIQVAFLLGFLLAFPALVYEAWAFFSPALEPRERRALGRSLPIAGLLFVTGATFAYVYIVPTLFRVLYAFAGPIEAAQYLTAGALVGTLATFALLFGLAFELPLVMVLLVRLRVVSPSAYLRKWRHVTVAIFVLAALVTDPTVVSQILVAALLLALYWSGVLLSFLARPITAPAAQPKAAGPVA